MKPLLVALPGNQELARALAARLDAEIAQAVIRQFPDGESYLRYNTELAGRDVLLVCTLSRPDAQAMPLMFAAEAARELGAASVALISPYLSYMRQDARFFPGEVVTSRHFAGWLSRTFDWLVTIDPHLHRYRSLDELYSIPTQVVQAAPWIARWVERHVENPVLVGPDEESEQWVRAVAEVADLPFVILEKVRSGDREVEVSGGICDSWKDHTPVILDDIISTGRTMFETLEVLQNAGMRAPVCIGVHGVFVDAAYEELLGGGVARVVTCNTITHVSNEIDVLEGLGAAVAGMLEEYGKAGRG